MSHGLLLAGIENIGRGGHFTSVKLLGANQQAQDVCLGILNFQKVQGSREDGGGLLSVFPSAIPCGINEYWAPGALPLWQLLLPAWLCLHLGSFPFQHFPLEHTSFSSHYFCCCQEASLGLFLDYYYFFCCSLDQPACLLLPDNLKEEKASSG